MSCIWAPAGANITISGDGLTWTSTASSNQSGIGTVGYVGGIGLGPHSTYLLYYEATCNAVGGSHGPGVGITSTLQSNTDFLGGGVGGGMGLYSSSYVLYLNAGDGTLFGFGASDVIGCFADFFNQKLWWTKNGTTFNNDILANQNPLTNTGGQVLTANAPFGAAGSYHTVVPGFGSFAAGDSMTANFGATPFHWSALFAAAVAAGWSAWAPPGSPSQFMFAA